MRNLKSLFLAASAFCWSSIASAQTVGEIQVGPWTNVVSFSINSDENHIVFSQLDADGVERAYESRLVNGAWSAAMPIAAINNVMAGATVGGLFMTENERQIYFHAKREGSTTGYDIFRSDFSAGKWHEPVRELGLSSNADDTYPSVVPGDQGVYLLRHQVAADEKTERKESDRQTIYFSKRNAQGKWSRLAPIHPVVSFGFVQDAHVAPDGMSLYYSVREDKKANAVAYFSCRSVGNSWLIPESILNAKGVDYFSPQVAKGNLYYIVGVGKRQRLGRICRSVLPDAKFKIRPVVKEAGVVVSASSKKPVVASFEVKDPTTSVLLGAYTSSSDDGSFQIVSPDKRSYLVDVRAEGFSYASFFLSYDGSGKPLLPQRIELFDSARIGITLYDAEIFRPVDGKVIAVRQSDKAIFRSVKKDGGRYEFVMPLDANYNVIATAKNYAESKFLFRLEGDVVNKSFERELSIAPLKRDISINLFDSETKSPVEASVVCRNMKREEVVSLGAGQSQTKLREGDSYAISVAPAGYAFKQVEVDLAKMSDKVINVELVALKVGTSVKIDNLLFQSGSAQILPVSYAELDRVAALLKENPSLRVELAAHTDNVGNADYNLNLSNQRANSVVDYLIDAGVASGQLVPKGYGSSKPLVPNTNAENRAVNRRVEFSILKADD